MGSVSVSVNPVVVVGLLWGASVAGLLWWLYAYIRWRLDTYVVRRQQQQQQQSDSGSESAEEEEQTRRSPRRRARRGGRE